MTNNAMSLGNLMYNGEYDRVISEGERLLSSNEHDAGVHLMLMDAYFKKREENPSNLDLSTEHARMAILYGHDTGYAHERLMKNLMATKQFNKSVQLADLVLRSDFTFRSRGCGDKSYFSKQREKAVKMADKATDCKTDILFTSKQIAYIISNTKKRLALEDKLRKMWDSVQKAYEYGKPGEFDKLLKQYHKLQESLSN